MRLDRLDLPLPAAPAAADRIPLDTRTRQALIKLLGRAIDSYGDTETRALAPALIAYLGGRPYEAHC